jgi:hypothetical protein
MKVINYKHFILVFYSLFLLNVDIYSQCALIFFEEKQDTLFFYSPNVTDSLKCSVRLYLIFSRNKEKNYNNHLSNVEVTKIDLRKQSNNKELEVLNCVDTM